jgi:hypothetical protein
MKEREVGLDTPPIQPVNQAGIEIETSFIPGPRPERLDARPGYRETVGHDAQGLDEIEISL